MQTIIRERITKDINSIDIPRKSSISGVFLYFRGIPSDTLGKYEILTVSNT